MSPSLTAANAIQSALRQRGIVYTHPVYGSDDVFTTESIAALIAEAYAGAVQIKPLVWNKLSSTQWSGRAACCHQCTIFLDDILSPIAYHLVAPSFPLHGPTRFSTLEAAQTAAQIEWDAFVRAVVEETPSSAAPIDSMVGDRSRHIFDRT